MPLPFHKCPFLSGGLKGFLAVTTVVTELLPVPHTAESVALAVFLCSVDFLINGLAGGYVATPLSLLR
jgi:hypothetical protein